MSRYRHSYPRTFSRAKRCAPPLPRQTGAGKHGVCSRDIVVIGEGERRVADWVEIQKDPKHMAREKAKAKVLRASSWWRNLLARGQCAYCQQTCAPDELTMDHIVPISRGGRSTKGNVVPCCQRCNASKRYWTPAELLLQQLRAQQSDAPASGGGPQTSGRNT
jgi:5-methylcytosine-specific restriction endonuclease McrA